jgi:hypothetical protein
MLGRRSSTVSARGGGPGSAEKVVMATVIDRGSGLNGSNPLHHSAPVILAARPAASSTAAAIAPTATAWRSKPVVAALLAESKAHAHLVLPHATVHPETHHTQGQAVPITHALSPSQRVVLGTIVATAAMAVAHRNGGIPTAATVLATPVHALAVPHHAASALPASAPSSAGSRRQQQRRGSAGVNINGKRAAPVPTSAPRSNGRSKLHAPDPLDQVDASGEGVTRCLCGDPSDDGFMIACESCGAWQHGDCVGLNEAGPVPDNYMCDLCDPDDPLHVRTREERQRRQQELVAQGGGTLAADGKRARRPRNRRRLTLGKKRRRGSASNIHAHGQGYSDEEEEEEEEDGNGFEYDEEHSGGEGSHSPHSHSYEEEEADGAMDEGEDGHEDDGDYTDSTAAAAASLPSHGHGTRNRKPLHVQTATSASASRRSGGGSSGKHHHRTHSRSHSHSNRGGGYAGGGVDPSASPSVAPSPTDSAILLSPNSTAAVATLTGAAHQHLVQSSDGVLRAASTGGVPATGTGSGEVTPAASPTGETKLRSLIFTMEKLANGEMTSPISTSIQGGVGAGGGAGVGIVGPGGQRYLYPGAGGSANPSAQHTPASSPGAATAGTLVNPFPLVRQISENTANMALTLTSGFAAPAQPAAAAAAAGAESAGGSAASAAAAADGSATGGIIKFESAPSNSRSTVILEAFSPVLPQHLTSSSSGYGSMALPPSALSALVPPQAAEAVAATVAAGAAAAAMGSNGAGVGVDADGSSPTHAPVPSPIDNLLLSPNTSAAISTLTSVGRAPWKRSPHAGEQQQQLPHYQYELPPPHLVSAPMKTEPDA